MNTIDMLAEAARIYAVWWQAHGSRPVTATELAEPVRAAADPDGRGRQYLAAKLRMLDGVRAAGFVLTRRPSVGRWSPGHYLLQRADAGDEPDRSGVSPPRVLVLAATDPARRIHAELETARRALERAARQMAALYPEILRIDAARDASIAAQEGGRE
ncbi:hypothetical protein [Humitalea rosea]|uniref:hypothetical protein n=1 Tax=Humitalea rosea TaxID=990373 RepID=UPI000DABC6B4|nr:hypothetical protein [Humitalea rosea]